MTLAQCLRLLRITYVVDVLELRKITLNVSVSQSQ